jgi:hypothetical protein
MKSLNVEISEAEYRQLGLKKNTLSLLELTSIIERRLTQKMLEKSIALADKYGLSEITLEEINDEIENYRNAQNNS